MPDRYAPYLRGIPRFTNLNADHLAVIGQSCVIKRFNPGEAIFMQGLPTTGLYLFIDGQAALLQTGMDGAARAVGQVGTGQYINLEALFGEGVETATLQVVRPSTVLFLSRQAFATALANHPSLRTALGIAGRAAHVHRKEFPSQREDEEVLLKMHRHWWAYARWSPLLVMLAGGLLLVASFVPVLGWLFGTLSFILPAGVMLFLYVEWMNDSIIITDQRVIRIHRVILTFSEQVSEVSIDSVQEANAFLPAGDPFAHLLNYGNVEIITPGDAGNLRLDYVPNPGRVQTLIVEDRRMAQARDNQRQQAAMRAELDRWLNQGPSAGQKPVTPGKTQYDPPPFSPFVARFETPEGTVYRKHWIVWWRAVAMPLLIILGAFVIFALDLFSPLFQSLGVIGWAIGFIILLVGGVWFYVSDWDWRNTYYLMNDSTIVLVRRRPLWLQNERDQIFLKQIDNVVFETKGFFQQVLRYGDVRISMVGADNYKVFRDVPDPETVQSDISRRRSRVRQNEENRREMDQQELLGQYFNMYHEWLTSNGMVQPGQPMPNMPGMPGMVQPGQPMPPGQPPAYPSQAGAVYPSQAGQPMPINPPPMPGQPYASPASLPAPPMPGQHGQAPEAPQPSPAIQRREGQPRPQSAPGSHFPHAPRPSITPGKPYDPGPTPSPFGQPRPGVPQQKPPRR